ncbi:MAG: ABC-three component system middle component 6 [Clostridia bacterium]|nr:ABC-three component system middle component 6 [Clostridia bacterium]
MILPSKHLSQDRALLTVGVGILQHLGQPKTVSAVWEELHRRGEEAQHSATPLKFDQFILALDLLFLMGAVQLDEGLLRRKKP